jgi:hypothetical protein
LNANDAKNANLRKIYIVDNYTDKKFTSLIICENLRHLRHLRAFEIPTHSHPGEDALNTPVKTPLTQA